MGASPWGRLRTPLLFVAQFVRIYRRRQDSMRSEDGKRFTNVVGVRDRNRETGEEFDANVHRETLDLIGGPCERPVCGGLLRWWHVVGVEPCEFFFPSVAGSLQQTNAAVPAKDGIVVAFGADFLGVAEAFERAFEKR